jgi:twinkle protein
MITRADDIRARLADQAESVCRYLLPHGEKKGRKWFCGDLYGGKGDSLVVELDGGKAGVWKDFASEDDKGSLLDLWMAAKRITFVEAFKEAKQWLGISETPTSNKRKTYTGKPKPEGAIKLQATGAEQVMQYLVEERKIPVTTLEAYNVCARKSGSGSWVMEFPIYAFDGKTLLNIKHLGYERKWNAEKNQWDKESWQEKDCPPGLFGWRAVDKESTSLIITEGEIDAMTWHQWGYQNALSIPAGAQGDQWIDWDWENLEPYQTIYLCFDNDEVGIPAAVKAAKRLGAHRCRIIMLPHKDSNLCLQKGCTVGDTLQWIKESQYLKPAELKTASDFRPQIHRLFNPPENDEDAGLRTPIFGRQILFRPGEMTLWTGHTSHGKTTLLSQIMVHAMLANQKVAIGSFEINGPTTIAKMIKCLAFSDELEPDQIDYAVDWLSDKLWLYAITGIVKRPQVLELMQYSVMRHGVKQVVIGSLMKCDMSSEDYELQRVFLGELHSFAQEYGIHLHVVGHPRKGSDDTSAPGIMDVHGGQSVIAQPDNVICVFRNKRKEKDRASGKMADHTANVEPDTIAFINKQRLTGTEGASKLWINTKCFRFTTHFGVGEPEFADFGIIKRKEENVSNS